MNKLFSVALLLLPVALSAETAAAPAATPAVERVIVRQQWPWSTDVKVEYSLSGVDAANPVDIKVRAFNGTVELPSGNLDAAITGDRYAVTSPVGSLTIDPVAAFGTEQVALGNFKVQLTLTPSDSNMNDIIYKIVDLDPPYNNVDIRRSDFYNGKYGKFVTSYKAINQNFSTELEDVLIWLDVTNDVYKTDKMVFRRIPAAGKSYMMQTNNTSVNGGVGIKVTFSRDFYIGVYEVTQAQMNKFYRWWGNDRAYSDYPPKVTDGYWKAQYCNSFETNEMYRAMRPASNIGVWTGYGHAIRNISNTKLASHEAGTGSFVGNMQNKTQLLVDLPTEAMWEYACRAGTSTDLYTGQVLKNGSTYYYERLDDICCQYRITTDRNCDLSVGSAIVGSYKPNAWGLYDMIGNIYEWCLDKEVSVDNLPGGTDPLYDSSTSSKHVLRGNSWNYNVNYNTSFSRVIYNANYEANTTNKGFGIRLCIYLERNDGGTL